VRKLTPEELEEERRMLERARTDRSAYGAIYDRYFDAIYSFALYQTGDRGTAEDITAATFQKGLEELHRYEWRGVPYGAWLYRVAASLISRQRRRPAWLELPLHIRDRESGPEEVWLRHEGESELHELLLSLPADQRQAIVLKFAGQLRNREIGDIMGRSEGAVKQLLFRGMAGLRRQVMASQLRTAL
jgi:RNA polymerase sigma-70 factor (ECF subfamily)